MPSQAAKVYVQDRLAQSAELVWRLLQAGAHFYVCGDAGGSLQLQLRQAAELAAEFFATELCLAPGDAA